jgi:hypothetical protein
VTVPSQGAGRGIDRRGSVQRRKTTTGGAPLLVTGMVASGLDGPEEWPEKEKAAH